LPFLSTFVKWTTLARFDFGIVGASSFENSTSAVDVFVEKKILPPRILAVRSAGVIGPDSSALKVDPEQNCLSTHSFTYSVKNVGVYGFCAICFL
jgi:hypothetical protein